MCTEEYTVTLLWHIFKVLLQVLAMKLKEITKLGQLQLCLRPRFQPGKFRIQVTAITM
jgi:hypothetical protein